MLQVDIQRLSKNPRRNRSVESQSSTSHQQYNAASRNSLGERNGKMSSVCVFNIFRFCLTFNFCSLRKISVAFRWACLIEHSRVQLKIYFLIIPQIKNVMDRIACSFYVYLWILLFCQWNFFRKLLIYFREIFGSRPSDHYFRSVCLSVCMSVCLFVCAEFFSAIFDPIWVKLGHMLHVQV